MKFDGNNMVEVLSKHAEWLKRRGPKHAFIKEAISYSPADFSDTDVSGYSFKGMNLQFANFYGARIFDVDFTEADLRYVNFRMAQLSHVDFREANLSHIVFTGTHFQKDIRIKEAYIRDTDFEYAINPPFIPSVCPDTGSFIGWKGAVIYNDAPQLNVEVNRLDLYRYRTDIPIIIKLLIPADAKRSSSTGRKCRCDKATVLEFQSIDGQQMSHAFTATSLYDAGFEYHIGETVVPRNPFNENRWTECGSGIHFFINRQEAVDFVKVQMR